jgi:hypothetical protein
MLLVRADAHREGLTFPSFVLNQRIDVEGLAAMAKSMGIKCWGMPRVEVMYGETG